MKAGIKKAVQISNLELPYDILITDILKGEKIKAFYNNITYPLTSNSVTVDRHALSIALGVKLTDEQYKTHNPTKRQNEFLQLCYKLAAKDLGVTGLECQAQTWESLRLNHKETLINSNNLLNL